MDPALREAGSTAQQLSTEVLLGGQSRFILCGALRMVTAELLSWPAPLGTVPGTGGHTGKEGRAAVRG